jgi:hypothetical protein
MMKCSVDVESLFNGLYFFFPKKKCLLAKKKLRGNTFEFSSFMSRQASEKKSCNLFVIPSPEKLLFFVYP